MQMESIDENSCVPSPVRVCSKSAVARRGRSAIREPFAKIGNQDSHFGGDSLIDEPAFSSASNSNNSSVGCVPMSSMKYGRMKAKYTFLATLPDELSFSKGDILDVIGPAKDDFGWLDGSVNGGPMKLVPSNYVESLVTNEFKVNCVLADIFGDFDPMPPPRRSSSPPLVIQGDTAAIQSNIHGSSQQLFDRNGISFKEGSVVDVKVNVIGYFFGLPLPEQRWAGGKIVSMRPIQGKDCVENQYCVEVCWPGEPAVASRAAEIRMFRAWQASLGLDFVESNQKNSEDLKHTLGGPSWYSADHIRAPSDRLHPPPQPPAFKVEEVAELEGLDDPSAPSRWFDVRIQEVITNQAGAHYYRFEYTNGRPCIGPARQPLPERLLRRSRSRGAQRRNRWAAAEDFPADAHPSHRAKTSVSPPKGVTVTAGGADHGPSGEEARLMPQSATAMMSPQGEPRCRQGRHGRSADVQRRGRQSRHVCDTGSGDGDAGEWLASTVAQVSADVRKLAGIVVCGGLAETRRARCYNW